jgi:hypothetical protein
MVKHHEPNYIELKDWYKNLDITPNVKKLILWDNNFLAATREHFDSVIDKLVELGIPCDFNQGLDCRLLDEHKAKRLGELDLICIRFAFDSVALQDGHFQKAMALARKSGVKADARIYVLYNFHDTPEQLYYRLKEIRKCENAKSFPMKYQDFNAKEKGEYVGEHWTPELITMFKKRLDNFYPNSIVGTQKWEIFNAAFGETPEEFMQLLKGEKQRTDAYIKYKEENKDVVPKNKDKEQDGMSSWIVQEEDIVDIEVDNNGKQQEGLPEWM